MAKGTIAGGEITYTAQLDITEVLINAGKAKKEITELEAWMVNTSVTAQSNYSKAQLSFQLTLRKTRLALAELKKEEREMVSQSEASGTATEAHTKKLVANRLAQQELLRGAREGRKVWQEVGASYNEVQKRVASLEHEIRNTAGAFTSQSPDLKAKIKEYNELSNKLKNFDESLAGGQGGGGDIGASAMAGPWGIAADSLKAAASFVAETAWNANLEASDALADLRIASGLTADEAENLSEELKKIDTRTSLKGLLEISTIGGQLGVAKEELSGFTQAIDQLTVSLGGELQGGAEGIAKTLGGIDSAFGITESNIGDVEKSFNQIGSAIIGLTQSGSSTGEFLTGFAESVGGIAAQAGLSVPAVLSYGAVLEESGVGADVASSSFNQLLSSLTSNKEDFFAVAKIADASLTLGDFTNLVETDAQQALQLFFAGLEKGSPTTASFNDTLQSLHLTGEGVSETVSILSSHQQELNGNLKTTSKNFNEATLSGDRFSIKNDTLAGSVDKLSNSFSNALTKGVIANFFKSIVDGLNEVVESFDKLFNSKSFKEFGHRLFDWDGGDGYVLETAAKENKRSIDNNQLFLHPRGSSPGYNEKMLKEKGEEFNKKFLSDLRKTMDEAERISKEHEAKNKNIPSFLIDKTITKRYNADYETAKAHVEEVLKLQKNLGFDKKKVPPTPNTKTVIPDQPAPKQSIKAEKPAFDTSLEARKKLQEEINAPLEKNKLKAKSQTEQEIAQVDEKYKALLEKAKTFNKEVDKFNNNPNNKKKRERVDVTGLNDTIIDEKAAVEDKQKATDLKKTIDEQKRLYDEFEDYKNKVGVENAKALYKDKINTDITYLDKLKELEKGVAGTEKKKGGKTDQQEKVVKDSLQAEKDNRDKKQKDAFANAYKAAETHVQKLAALEKDYNDKKAALGDKATADQLANLEREHRDKVRAQNESNSFAQSGYAELMANYDQLTRGEIQKRLETINAGYDQEYELGRITAEQLANLKSPVTGQMDKLAGDSSFNKIGGLIKNWKAEVGKFGEGSQGAEKAFKKLAGGIGAVAGDVNQVLGSVAGGLGELGIGGEGLQEAFKSVSGVVDGIGGIAKGISSGNPVEVITGSIKLLTSAMELFNTKDKKLEKQIKKYKEQLVSLGDSYKKLERSVANSVGESIYTDQASQIENLKQQQILLTQARDAERSKKKADQSKIDEFQSQIDSIPNQIEDIEKAIAQNLIQTTFKDLSNSLADAFTEAFSAGEDAAGRFDDVFEKVIANAIKNSLKLKLLDPVVKNFTDDLAKYAQENGNSVVGFDFETYKAKLKAAGDLFTAGLKGSEDFFKGASTTTSTNTNTLSGSIKAEMSEATGTLVAGAMNGMRITQIETNALLTASNKTLGDLYLIARDKFTVQVKIEANTFRTAVNTDRLENIEYALMSMDKKMNLNTDALKASGRLS